MFMEMQYVRLWLASVAIISFSLNLHYSQALLKDKHAIQSATFLSPPFDQQPGSVSNKYYYNISFPEGHVGIKSFNAEVVDEHGNSVPLHETYLHHWLVLPYYTKVGTQTRRSKLIPLSNAGICKSLGQYFGLGSETRRTSTHIPDGYGIEVGDPTEIPYGYELRWLLNVHAIDTRGVEDRLGCTECRCSLYNVTEDGEGRPLNKDYIGGLSCCYDQTQCRLKKGFESSSRKLYLKYTVKWVDWNESVKPVKIYIFDVTYTASEGDFDSSCKIEYEVKKCTLAERRENGECVDSKKVKMAIPGGGEMIYGVAHQHSRGTGSALYGQDGRLLCSSMPTYGKGREPGNEAGYIVGMSTCYPKPGSVTIGDGEVLTLVSNYSSAQMHTGVMGLFYILVAEP